MRRAPLALTALGAVVALAACEGPAGTGRQITPSPAREAERVALKFGGLDRSYRLYRPPGLRKADPVPLLLVLHGLSGSGIDMEVRTGFDNLADAHRFVVVYPDGYAGSWNTGDLVGTAGERSVDDVGFIDFVIGLVNQQQTLDASRIFATGFSQGAVMSHHLGCELSAMVSAIASMEGALWGRPCHPTMPVSVLQIHGTADTGVPYPGMVRELSGGTLVDRHVTTVDLWRQLDGCSAPAAHDVQGDVSRDTYDGCRGRVAVAFYSVAGLGHDIAPREQFDEPAAIWAFLSQHGRVGAA